MDGSHRKPPDPGLRHRPGDDRRGSRKGPAAGRRDGSDARGLTVAPSFHAIQEETTMKQSLGPRTLLFPAPVLLVGTYDREGKPNLMNAAWGGICCSQPPCVAVSLRKAGYSYAAIGERRAFTIGIPSEAQ